MSNFLNGNFVQSFYYLVGKTPVRCMTEQDLFNAYHQKKIIERVNFTKINDYIDVSTVFLVTDYNHEPTGEPILFETMVFDNKDRCSKLYGYMRRYSTWDEAEKGHDRMVAFVKRYLRIKQGREGATSLEQECSPNGANIC